MLGLRLKTEVKVFLFREQSHNVGVPSAFWVAVVRLQASREGAAVWLWVPLVLAGKLTAPQLRLNQRLEWLISN